jgi:DNA (cytosine-5)-methyltransferase 1
MKIGSLFSGYGGLDLAVTKLTGAEVAWHCEWEAAPSQILEAHFPGVPNYRDVSKVDFTQVEPVDILTGGFPCQDLSLAGKRAGLQDGTRSGLWSEFYRAIQEIKPKLVIIENVRGLLSAKANNGMEYTDEVLGILNGKPAIRALGAVLGDLADIGYDAKWSGVRASDAGAPHQRFRVFILAYPSGGGGQSLPTPTVSDQYTSNLSSTQQKLGSMHSVTLAQVFQKPDLFPTPNTMEHLPARTGEARERQLYRGGSTSRRNSSGNLREDILDLIPTPTTRDYKDGSQPHERGGKVQTDTVARAVFNSGEINLPTPTASDWKGANNSGSGSASSRGIATVADQLKLFNTPTTMDAKATNNPEIAQKFLDQGRQTCLTYDVATNWGKFEPAIRRWEAVIGRPAPEPTKPDGKEGNHRLSSKFTEWMMGLPDGWITDIGLKRNDELKACGNGVVPQQAELALSLLGIKEILER